MIDHVCSPEQEAVRVALRTQRTHLQRVLKRHEQERDAVAQRLLELAAELLGSTHPQLLGDAGELDEAPTALQRGQLAELLHELGMLAERLHPPLLDDLGIGAALDRLAEAAARRELRPVSVVVDQRIERLADDVALVSYRVVEDLLAATRGPLRIRLWRLSNGWIQLVAVAGAGGVSGHVVRPERLALAHARVELLGGVLESSTPRGGGVLLHAEVPA